MYIEIRTFPQNPTTHMQLVVDRTDDKILQSF